MVARFHYDRSTLRSWIDDGSNDATGEVASHVESCVTCQTTLESLFNEGLSLEKAGELLRHPPAANPAESWDDDKPKVLATFAKTLLDPPEHSGSLGRFARYEVMEFLGRGGMGIVMRGFDPALNRHSAIKVLAPELASSAAARRRFSREAKSAAAVIHPHVVPIQTVDKHNGLPYLVMSVVDGDSVQQRVERRGPLETIEVVRIAAQVARGLAAAHEQGLVHRDIKRWLVSLASVGVLAVFGIVIALETNKGTLHIETSGDVEVLIRITQSGKTIETLTVSSEGATTRLYAGEYVLEFDTLHVKDQVGEMEIENGSFSLKRGDEWTAKVRLDNKSSKLSAPTGRAGSGTNYAESPLDYGMPPTQSPMGLPGPPHIPLGAPAGGNQSKYEGDHRTADGSTQFRFMGPPELRMRDSLSSNSKTPFEPLPQRRDYAFGTEVGIQIMHRGTLHRGRLKVPLVTAAIRNYLAHNLVPITITKQDLDQVTSLNYVVKAMYLPEREATNPILAPVETIVSTRVGPGVDVVSEASRRGTLLAVLKLWHEDEKLNPAGTDLGEPDSEALLPNLDVSTSATTEAVDSLQGTWQLIEVEQGGKAIAGDKLIEWLGASPDFSQLIFHGNSMVLPFQRVLEDSRNDKAKADAKTYELHIRTGTEPHRFIGSKGPVVLFNGIYRLSTDDGSRQLTIVLPEGKGPSPSSFETESTKTMKLTYERILGPAIEDDTANTNEANL